ncbi:DNA glycosylase AlkZ-like family protein [Microbacterium rhizomatis]|uniref:Winged helix-turn-helix domain-containing protein n=1 Tax=Microbacterium rhizomatis TaxID=1631477 RepID=A0A5J5IX00_9MICO|nr:crosslink repair DNA glycosylase YcaQ family protein [Microbacterium rhizomatis]KAA9105672.1 winged helix-turn-helix domain-containing protein [Microbacterium rhizomatis]
MVLRLTRQEARRIAIASQRLCADRPGDVVEVLEELTIVNIDPTAAIMPSADHILWSRIGWAYEPGQLKSAVEIDRTVFELDGFYRPMSALPLLLPSMRAWPPPEWRKHRHWLDANDRFRRDILERIGAEGPLTAREIPDSSLVPWSSTGWTNNRNVTQMLEFLARRGELAIAGRRGRDRVWDLADRVYPAVDPRYTVAEAELLRARERLRSQGIAREKAAAQPVEPIDVGVVGERAEVEGVPGTWRVDPEALQALEAFEGRTALLSPFDRLVFDRVRAQDLFGFEYIVEMYKPAAQRRWGYFALPILRGDSLIGKLDAAADRKAGVLRVAAIHEDAPFDLETADAVDTEIRSLGEWLGLRVEGLA